MASLDDVHNQEPSDVTELTGTVQKAQTYTVSTKSTNVIARNTTIAREDRGGKAESRMQ